MFGIDEEDEDDMIYEYRLSCPKYHSAAKKVYDSITKPSEKYCKNPLVDQDLYDDLFLATHQELKTKMEGLFFDLDLAGLVADRYLTIYDSHLKPSLKRILYESYGRRSLSHLFEELYHQIGRDSPLYIIIGMIIKKDMYK